MLPWRSSIPVVFTIQSGLHSGASLPLGRDTRIGRTAENQIRLLDDGIADDHARLTLHHKGLTVTPLAGDVSVGGTRQDEPATHRLGPGQSLELQLGSVAITLARPSQKGFHAGYLFGLGLLAVAVVLPMPWFGSRQPAALALRSDVADQTAVMPQRAQASPTLEELSHTVTARFAAFGLGEDMKISVDGSNGRPLSTTITGLLDPAKATDFEAFLAWYDAQPGRPALFNLTRRQSPDERALPRIASVLLQPVPGLITDTGRHMMVGETMSGGWVLTSVDPSAVVLTLDGEVKVITLGKPREPSAP